MRRLLLGAAVVSLGVATPLAAPLTTTPSPAATPLPTMAAILRANASAAANSTLAPFPAPTIVAANNTNITLVADDEFSDDLGYSDIQIVFLACLFTAAPLLAVLLSILGVRFVWRKFQGDVLDDDLDEMLRRAETRTSLSQEQLKTSESQFTVLASDDAESGRGAAPYANHSVSVVCGPAMDGLGGGAGGGCGGPPPHRQTQHNTMSSRSSNGSVITLTMHNNLLIVAKEEIVESEAGPDDHLYDEALATPQLCAPSLPPPPSVAYSDQKAIVHQPPAAAATPALTKGAETGLSQPDLSTGSDENPPYSYGNQVGYDAGPLGYAQYNGYRVDEPPSRHRHVAVPAVAAAPTPRPAPPPDVVAVVPHSALQVQDSIDAQDGIQDLPEDSPQPQRLMSDIRAREDALQHQGEAVPNGGAAVDAVAVDAGDDGEDDSTSADVCSVKAQSPLPPSRALTLGLVPGAAVADQPLRSPVVDKLRLEEATPLAERFPATSPGHGPRTPPAPKSPLATTASGKAP